MPSCEYANNGKAPNGWNRMSWNCMSSESQTSVLSPVPQQVHCLAPRIWDFLISYCTNLEIDLVLTMGIVYNLVQFSSPLSGIFWGF